MEGDRGMWANVLCGGCISCVGASGIFIRQYTNMIWFKARKKLVTLRDLCNLHKFYFSLLKMISCCLDNFLFPLEVTKKVLCFQIYQKVLFYIVYALLNFFWDHLLVYLSSNLVLRLHRIWKQRYMSIAIDKYCFDMSVLAFHTIKSFLNPQDSFVYLKIP